MGMGPSDEYERASRFPGGASGGWSARRPAVDARVGDRALAALVRIAYGPDGDGDPSSVPSPAEIDDYLLGELDGETASRFGARLSRGGAGAAAAVLHRWRVLVPWPGRVPPRAGLLAESVPRDVLLPVRFRYGPAGLEFAEGPTIPEVLDLGAGEGVGAGDPAALPPDLDAVDPRRERAARALVDALARLLGDLRDRQETAEAILGILERGDEVRSSGRWFGPTWLERDIARLIGERPGVSSRLLGAAVRYLSVLRSAREEGPARRASRLLGKRAGYAFPERFPDEVDGSGASGPARPSKGGLPDGRPEWSHALEVSLRDGARVVLERDPEDVGEGSFTVRAIGRHGRDLPGVPVTLVQEGIGFRMVETDEAGIAQHGLPASGGVLQVILGGVVSQVRLVPG